MAKSIAVGRPRGNSKACGGHLSCHPAAGTTASQLFPVRGGGTRADMRKKLGHANYCTGGVFLPAMHIPAACLMAIGIQDGITLGVPGINVRLRYPETLCNKLAWWENTLSCPSSFDFILLDYHLYGIPDVLIDALFHQKAFGKKITQSKIYSKLVR